MPDNAYVLITPARNEGAFIEKTLRAVIAQTILPKKWVIVSDNSIDRTDEIVHDYSTNHHFIQFVRLEGQDSRNFSSKVDAFDYGYDRLGNIDYDYIGVLDADISFGSDYYKDILAKFQKNQQLGIAGGIRYDLCNGKFAKVMCARNSVGGPFQLFRRQCFEAIGGFTPVDIGGEDAIAEITARMSGWNVESFPEIQAYHYRCTGTAIGNVYRARFNDGKKEYMLGYHPLFEIARCGYRMKMQSSALADLFRMVGYFGALCRRYKRPVSKDFIKYLRSEQIGRLKAILSKDKDAALPV